MIFRVPIIEPIGKGPLPVIKRIELVDGSGEIIGEEDADPFAYLTPQAIVEAFNERADFELWRNRKSLPDAVPGIWRGMSIAEALEFWKRLRKR